MANRGEIAVRVIRACREMGYPTVAVYSEPDRASLHVVYADEALPIGPAPSRQSYLRVDRILEAAKKSGAEAIHPGYGFLAENAEFARACRDAGILFIGPSPESIDAMGSKTESRRRMQAAGVPVVPGLIEAVKSFDEIAEFAKSAGLPIMIKASAGGGGKGLRLVEREEDLRPSFERVTSEAESFFGDGAVYAEKFIASPRHIEVQVLGDQHGNTIHLGERECTLQRRHQKVLEECPSPVVDAELRERLGAMECLMGPDREFYFLEMNTRLQVEHPVTEMVWGIDIVKWQLRIAQGETLDLDPTRLAPTGHAIECRIYAEDPSRKFAPSPGLIRYLNLPQGPGVRNENGVYAGYTVPRGGDRADETRARGVPRRRDRDHHPVLHLHHERFRLRRRQVRHRLHRPPPAADGLCPSREGWRQRPRRCRHRRRRDHGVRRGAAREAARGSGVALEGCGKGFLILPFQFIPREARDHR